jgi:hypothetical protein
LAGDLSIGLVFWVTGSVTLVVQSVRYGVTSAKLACPPTGAHVLKGALPAPGDNHIIDVYSIVPRPQHPLVYPQESSFKDEGFHKPLHMPDGEAGDTSETLIGNPGVLAKEVGFGEDGV